MNVALPVALTCWLCALIALPRRPLPGNEVQQLVYTRLLGRQRWLVLLASLATAATLLSAILSLAMAIDPGLQAARDSRRVCPPASIDFPVCYRLQADGMWAREEIKDGQWVVVDTVPGPPTGVDPTEDRASIARKR